MKYLIFMFVFLVHSESFAKDGIWEDHKDELFTLDLLAQGIDCNITLYDYNEIDHVNGQDCANEKGFHSPIAQPKRTVGAGTTQPCPK